MGKIEHEINRLILNAIKDREKDKENAYKNLKAKLIEYKTQPGAPELTDAAEITIINKMVRELQNDADIFKKNGREDLEFQATVEAGYLIPFLPKEASEEEIKAVIEENLSADMTMKDMGKLVKLVKSKFENADGKLVATLVKSYLTK